MENGKRGSKNYIQCLIKESNFQVRLSSKIASIYRQPKVQINTSTDKQTYDYLIFASTPYVFTPTNGQKCGGN